MSRQRIMAKLRKQDYFKPIMALLEELGIEDYDITPPRGRGHAILKFNAAGGEHRIPLPGSPSSRSAAENYLSTEIRRRVRGMSR
ncbi:hypothetical protein XM25_00590 [Devosia sp. H5989]|nr:hypothetical protein XM25_00590 [Devosia sp. H5989]